MGGFGTWELAMTFPDRFAAIAPVCGGGNDVPIRIARLKKLPIWVFHGAKDQVVPLSQSQKMVDALKAVDGNVRFTIYPDAGHSFMNDGGPAAVRVLGRIMSVGYHADSAEDAWQRILTFFYRQI